MITITQYKKLSCLAERSRAMLRVIEYFAKSLEVTQVIRNDTPE